MSWSQRSRGGNGGRVASARTWPLVRSLAVLGSMALVFAALAPSATAAPAPAAKAARTPVCNGRLAPGVLGAYTGAGNADGLRSFAAGTGHPVAIASDYLPGNTGWAGMSTAHGIGWLLKDWGGTGCILSLGVPIIPANHAGTPQGSLAAGAAGKYNAQFVTLARTLIAGGQPWAILRLGWEFNGNWFPWKVQNTTDARNFAAYWRNIVTAMRSVHGGAFSFVWNPNNGGSYGSWTPAQAYPGNAYVTEVGMDVYDQCWCTPKTPANTWSHIYGDPWGLRWLTSFSKSTGKPIAIPEWGETIRSDGHGLGDDPYYVSSLAQWSAVNHVVFTSYFDFNSSDGQHDILDTPFHNALLRFRTVKMGTAART